MKKVLVLSYYFPPCNGAPSWRPYSWVQNFSKHNLRPFVITRHWNGDENTWSDFIKPCKKAPHLECHADYDVLYLPSRSYKLNLILEKHEWIRKVIGNLYFFLLALMGRFNTEVDVWLAFRKHLKNHLRENTYDAVIVSSPPSNILQLIPLIRKYSDAVIVADIRDLWNNLMLSVPYHPGLKQRLWDLCYASYYKKWLREVDLVTVIVPPFSEIISKLTNAPIKVVYNGYESDMFSRLKKVKSGRFTFSVVGNIYPEQDIRILLDGLREFTVGKSPEQVAIRFIGAASLPEVAAKIQASLPVEFLYVSGRVSKEEALQETRNADVLSYSGWKGVRGIISTKVFDYVASGNYVLIAPGDNDVLDAFVKECNCGSSVHSKEEFVARMNELYNIWLENGDVPVNGDETKIAFYSREMQAGIMADAIMGLVNARQK